MAITFIPNKTNTDAFIEAFLQSWLPRQQARQQALLQQKLLEQQYKTNLERSREAYPELFVPTPDYVSAPRGMENMPGVVNGQMPVRPAIPKSYQFLANKAQPGMEFNATTGEMTFKKPSDDIFTQMAKYKMLSEEDKTGFEMPKSKEEVISEIKAKGESPNRYIIEPVYSSSKGVKIISGYSAKPKPTKVLPQSQLKAIEDTQATLNNLYRIKQKASEVLPTGEYKYKTGPGELRYDANIPFNQKIMALRGKPGEAAYKSDITDTQATYLSAKTGAQRGFKEIQWMEPAMPSANLPPIKMLEVTESAIQRMEQNYKNLIDNAKKSGYDVSGYESEETMETPSEDLSTMSDEELRRIANGGK